MNQKQSKSLPCQHCSEGFHPIGTVFCPNTGKPLKSNLLKIVSAFLAAAAVAVVLITGIWFIVEHFRKPSVADLHPEPVPTVTEYQAKTLQIPVKDDFHRELTQKPETSSTIPEPAQIEPEPEPEPVPTTTSTTLEPVRIEPEPIPPRVEPIQIEPEPIPRVEPKPVINPAAPFSIHEDRYQILFDSLIKAGMKPERIVEIFSSAKAKRVDMTPVEKMSEKVIVPISERTAKESRLIAGKIKKHLENYGSDIVSVITL